MIEKLRKLAEMVEREFPDIVEFAEVTHKLRIFIVDGSFVDVWLSKRLNRYAYHWEKYIVVKSSGTITFLCQMKVRKDFPKTLSQRQ